MSRTAPTGALGAFSLALSLTVTPALATPQAVHPAVAAETASATTTVERLAGEDRYETAARIAQQWSGPVDQVYVVTGATFHDALIAAASAGARDVPVLLTTANRLPTATVRQLERLQPTTITIVGGRSGVSDSVQKKLGAFAGAGGVERLAATNRYTRSALLAEQYPAGVDRVYLASGEDFPDALSVAALAGSQGQPLMLTQSDKLPKEVAAQIARLRPAEVVVVGGRDSVGSWALKQAEAVVPSGQVRRVSGADRYLTSAAVAKEFDDVEVSYVASGEFASDALVLSALAARDETAVVLTRAGGLADGSVEALDHLLPEHVYVAGGQQAVSDRVLEQIRARTVQSLAPEPEPPVEAEPPTDPEPPAPEPDPTPEPPAPEPPSGFPTSETTGVPDGVPLTPSGSLTITEDDTVIDGLHVRGEIQIYANNVTIKNTLVESATSSNPVYVDRGTTGTLLESVEIDNLGGGGIGVFMRGSGSIRFADIHSAEDGVRINSDDVTVEYSYIHDMVRESGGHHDSIQIRRGDDVTIRGNNLQSYVAATDDPQNAAIQIGSLSGDDQISNLLVIGNLMNGGNYTINGGGRWEVDSARYAENEFGRDYRFGVAGNVQNSVWEDTNVWHDTGEPVD
ncbi:cell wall-binding repeat-containing protein [uncultured Ornithinimicrobium sp.]|uniref:cell wall-binding repeat-containing protein n=1 Tax=uncultured Ornithinimicrobium sp. TaxID=259307 RepID=UPI002593315C|nr:cell wall-binding repeat-containing protein [uncultured Ornithinimicrobium sp.]